MKKFLTSIALVGMASTAFAAVPHQFKSGENISAQQVNENFAALVDEAVDFGAGQGTTYKYLAHATEAQVRLRTGHAFNTGELTFKVVDGKNVVTYVEQTQRRFMSEQFNGDPLQVEKTARTFDWFCSQGTWSIDQAAEIVTVSALVTSEGQCDFNNDGKADSPNQGPESEQSHYEGIFYLVEGGNKVVGNVIRFISSDTNVADYRNENSYEKEVSGSSESIVWSINGFKK